MSAEIEAAQRIAAYVAAREAFTRAEAEANDIHGRLTAAARAIGDPRDYSCRRSFNAGNPNAEINAIPATAHALAVMGQWAKARVAVREAWAKLAPGEQRHVQDLPRNAGSTSEHR